MSIFDGRAGEFRKAYKIRLCHENILICRPEVKTLDVHGIIPICLGQDDEITPDGTLVIL